MALALHAYLRVTHEYNAGNTYPFKESSLSVPEHSKWIAHVIQTTLQHSEPISRITVACYWRNLTSKVESLCDDDFGGAEYRDMVRRYVAKYHNWKKVTFWAPPEILKYNRASWRHTDTFSELRLSNLESMDTEQLRGAVKGGQTDEVEMVEPLSLMTGSDGDDGSPTRMNLKRPHSLTGKSHIKTPPTPDAIDQPLTSLIWIHQDDSPERMERPKRAKRSQPHSCAYFDLQGAFGWGLCF